MRKIDTRNLLIGVALCLCCSVSLLHCVSVPVVSCLACEELQPGRAMMWA